MGPFLVAQFGRLFLTLLTLGLHRFWWKTAIRRRLWSETTIDGDPLEYRGRGLEMFIGALIVFGLVLVPLSALSIAQTLLKGAGMALAAAGLQLAVFALLFWLLGFAVYRSRRYLLSRTAWRGIRGGMTGNGLAYAWLSVRLTLLTAVTLGFATPYADARRWNALWGDVMFGTMPVRADLSWRELMKTFAPAYVGSILAYAIAFGMGFEGAQQLWKVVQDGPAAIGAPESMLPLFKLYGYLAIAFFASLFLMLGYKAEFQSQALAATSLGAVRFGFLATTGDWLRFYVGNVAIVVLTLGVGLLLLKYRQWRFWMAHLEIHGELDTEAIRQSVLVAPIQGDGLADAFDVGGI
jgi:uncharacterized membrane protein YjgN (DUF898 family)